MCFCKNELLSKFLRLLDSLPDKTEGKVRVKLACGSEIILIVVKDKGKLRLVKTG